ncbi:MAG: beta-ketoacyl-ACP reductase [Cyclobacteriaceae bacterium]
MERLSGKVGVITGGASGIGAATVQKFKKEGAKVIIWDVQASNEKLDESLVVDTSKVDQVMKAAKQTIEKYGRIDILINNAGITRDASILKMTPENWQQVIDVNLTGVFNCIKAVSPSMIENQYGRIINTSSVVGLYGNYGQANYAASKAGLIGLTKTLARELGKHSITVNAVAPGFIATEMIKTIPEKVVAMMKEKTPLKRTGTPDDVANAYLFLASEEASFISGSTLSVDGGLTV